jgi:hypothetical protein
VSLDSIKGDSLQLYMPLSSLSAIIAIVTVQSTMRKTSIKVKKFFEEKKNKKATLTGNVASAAVPDSGTTSQIFVPYQSDPGSRIRVGVTSPRSGAASSAAPAELETGLQVSSTKQSGIGSGAIVDTFETVLGILKEVSAPFTPLQAAVGGVIECIHIYKVGSRPLTRNDSLICYIASIWKYRDPSSSCGRSNSSHKAYV